MPNLIFPVPPETFEAREDQGLLADGGGVHQEPGETEAPGGEERGGEEQGILNLSHFEGKLSFNLDFRLTT